MEKFPLTLRSGTAPSVRTLLGNNSTPGVPIWGINLPSSAGQADVKLPLTQLLRKLINYGGEATLSQVFPVFAVRKFGFWLRCEVFFYVPIGPNGFDANRRASTNQL